MILVGESDYLFLMIEPNNLKKGVTFGIQYIDTMRNEYIWEINANCCMVLELEGTPIGNEMVAIQQKWFSSFEEFIDHKDEIRFYDVGDGAALAEFIGVSAIE